MTVAQRKHAKALIELFHSHASQCGYPPHDNRTALDNYDWHLTEAQMTTLLLNKHSIQFDCSETDSWIYKCVGAWACGAPAGYTGTWLSMGLERYSDGARAGLAAPVIFGIETKPDGHHMGLVYKTDPKHGNPVIAEHGRPGFDLTPLHDVVTRQTAEGYPGYTFLNVSRL